MNRNSEQLGNYVKLVDNRNVGMITNRLLGISIDKYFMPSVANIIGTDLGNYKLITKGQFACNPMHVGRDERLPVALYFDDEPAIVSPAYFLFQVIDEKVLLPEYLMMWFGRTEFDRICWFKTDGSIRGSISWEDLCRIELPVPDISVQRSIIDSYNTIERRIRAKQQINDNLVTAVQAIYKDWFVSFRPFLSKGVKDTEIGTIPEDWTVKRLSDVMQYSGGSQPPASEFKAEYQHGYVRFVQIRDYETSKYTTYIPVSKKNKLCDEHDIMIARYGVSLGRICFGLNGAYNVALAKITPGKAYYREFLRCYFNTQEFYNGINGSGERSAQQGFNQSGMDAFKLAFPPEDILRLFNHMITPLFDLQLQIRKEIELLKNLQSVYLQHVAQKC